MDERKQKLIALLNTPSAERKGTAGYLVDKWHMLHDAREKLGNIVTRKEAELNEARTQLVKAAGAVEAVEAMLVEFDAKASNVEQSAPPLPPPLSPCVGDDPQPPPDGVGPAVEEARRKALVKVAGARAAAAAAGFPVPIKPVPVGDTAKKGDA